jgi:peptide/nickel transport system permease protein
VLLVLFGVSLVTFAIIPLLPGSPARVTLGVQATPAAVAALERQMGLDRPLPVQYVSWIGGILTRGDFGTSLISRQPIASEVRRRLPATATLALVRS